jgi:flagellar basal-body rod protein FlgF
LAVPPYTQIALAADGTISVVPQGQGPETLAQVGRLKLVNPPAQQLEKRADGLVRVKGGAPAASDANVRVVSGAIETSNVNTAATLVDMIEYARQFDLAVRMMQTADQNATRATSLASLN